MALDLKPIFDALQRAEGYVAAAYQEATSPPYKAGRAHENIAKVRDVLAILQKHINASEQKAQTNQSTDNNTS